LGLLGPKKGRFAQKNRKKSTKIDEDFGGDLLILK